MRREHKETSAESHRGRVAKMHPLPASPASLEILRREVFAKCFLGGRGV